MHSKLESIVIASGGTTAFGCSQKLTPGGVHSYAQHRVYYSKFGKVTKTIFEGHTKILNEIQETACQGQVIEVEVINDILQVSAPDAIVSLNSSYIQG